MCLKLLAGPGLLGRLPGLAAPSSELSASLAQSPTPLAGIVQGSSCAHSPGHLPWSRVLSYCLAPCNANQQKTLPTERGTLLGRQVVRDYFLATSLPHSGPGFLLCKRRKSHETFPQVPSVLKFEDFYC